MTEYRSKKPNTANKGAYGRNTININRSTSGNEVRRSSSAYKVSSQGTGRTPSEVSRIYSQTGTSSGTSRQPQRSRTSSSRTSSAASTRSSVRQTSYNAKTAAKRREEARKAKRKRVIRNRICLALIFIALVLLIIMIVVAIGKLKGEENTNHTPSAQTTEAETESPSSKETEKPTHSETTAPSEETDQEVFDNQPPVITGDAVIYVAKGSRVKYKSYVYVEDDNDYAPELVVDNSQVDLTREGTYEVIYTATDASGNSTSKVVQLVVGAEEEPDVDEETIYALADQVLDRIIDNDMTDLEKVFAVFYYARDSFSYIADQTHWEYKQEAYHMMTTLADSCYANSCVVKLLLERLGYECILCQGELSYVDEYHYWNMVSIDGGTSWYHLDAAWWTWMRSEYPLCMMTDEYALEISRRHNGLWQINNDLYPQTPSVSLWTEEDYDNNPRLREP